MDAFLAELLDVTAATTTTKKPRGKRSLQCPRQNQTADTGTFKLTYASRDHEEEQVVTSIREVAVMLIVMNRSRQAGSATIPKHLKSCVFSLLMGVIAHGKLPSVIPVPTLIRSGEHRG